MDMSAYFEVFYEMRFYGGATMSLPIRNRNKLFTCYFLLTLKQKRLFLLFNLLPTLCMTIFFNYLCTVFCDVLKITVKLLYISVLCTLQDAAGIPQLCTDL